MELYRLRAFVAVAEEGHMTRAAERLHVSQPAVSGQIKALEDEFNLRLFQRNANGMALTVAGRSLLDYARRVLTASDEMARAAKRLNGEIAGALRIGTVSDPASIRVGQLLARAVEQHPNLELQLQHEVSGAALDGVREGRLDASFYFGDAPGPEFNALRLRQFVYCITGPATWAEQLRNAGWSDITALPWIVTPAISTHNRLVTELFAAHGIEPPQRRIESDQESVIEDLIVSGVGVSLMREESARARQQAGEVSIWKEASVRTTLWFVCAAARSDDPLLRAVFDILHDLWRDERTMLLRGQAARDELESAAVAR